MTKNNIAPVRRAQHDKLSVFIGKWHAEGQSYAAGQTREDPRAKAETWTSDETFEWIDGKFFVLQRWQAMTGKNPFAGIGVLEYDEGAGCYRAHSFENHGFVRDYKVTVDGNTWMFEGDVERAKIVFKDEGWTQVIAWEWRPEGDEWLPLCDRTARLQE